MLRTLLILPLCIWLTLASAVNLDSLWGVWNDKNQPDSNRLNAIHTLIWKEFLFSKTDSALKLTNMQNELAVKSKNNYEIATSLSTKGIAYNILGDHINSMKCYNQSLSIYEEIQFHSGIASCLNNIGNLYLEQDEILKAINFYKKSLKIIEETGNKEKEAQALANLSNIYFQNDDLSKSKKALDKSFKIANELKDNFIISTLYKLYGDLYFRNDSIEKAISYYNKSLNFHKKNNNQISITTLLSSLGDVYYETGQIQTSISYNLNALSIAKETSHHFNQKKITRQLYQCYKAQGNSSKALEIYEEYILLRDSIINEENTRSLIQQEYNYKYEKEQAKHLEEIKLSSEREKHQQLITYGASAGLLFVLGFTFLIFNRLKVIRKQRNVIKENNRQFKESMNYARRIQNASLTSDEYLNDVFENYFIFYQPRDIVSGDFYWAYKLNEDKCLVAVCDCTGHGVPGGFMSMMSIALLNEIVVEKGITQVDEVLGELRSQIMRALKQEKKDAEALDGLDMTLLLLDKNKQSVDFAGAGHTLFQKRDKEIIEHKGDNFPVGFFFGREKPYTRKQIQLKKGDVIYMKSDGFTEQFGGKENKFYGNKRFENLILESGNLPMEEQKEKFSRSYNNWKGAQKQIDDVCVMGIRI